MTSQSISILKTAVLAGLLLAPIAAAGQSPRSTPAPTPAAGAPRPARTTTPSTTIGRPWNEQEYRLGPGDKLRVEVYREPQLSQSLQVRPDGKITLPLVGDVAATGRTSIELRDSLTTSLKEYVTNPVVTVIVQEATAAQIFIIGEVPNPGAQVMQGPLTALQALAQAGARSSPINATSASCARAAWAPSRFRSTTRTRSEGGSNRCTCSPVTRWWSRSPPCQAKAGEGL
jgi:polysaccharide biosynthesis/export protein